MAQRKRREDRFQKTEASHIGAVPSFQMVDGCRTGDKVSIDVSELEPHPENWDIVPKIDGKKRAEVKDSILANGILEPLHIWPSEGKLFVVSGSERLEILNEIPVQQRQQKNLDRVPCIVFRLNKSEARHHIVAANEAKGKTVKLSPVDRVLKIWPPNEFENLYKRFQGNQNQVSPTGETYGQIWEWQRSIRAEIASVNNWTDRFTENTISKARRKLEDSHDVEVEIDAAAKKEIVAAKKELASLRPGLEKIEREIEDKKAKASQIKIGIRKAERVLKKYGETV